jgi:hypothetical protein
VRASQRTTLGGTRLIDSSRPQTASSSSRHAHIDVLWYLAEIDFPELDRLLQNKAFRDELDTELKQSWGESGELNVSSA